MKYVLIVIIWKDIYNYILYHEDISHIDISYNADHQIYILPIARQLRIPKANFIINLKKNMSMLLVKWNFFEIDTLIPEVTAWATETCIYIVDVKLNNLL